MLGRKEPFCKGLLIIIKSNAYSYHNRHLNRSCPKEYATDLALREVRTMAAVWMKRRDGR